MSLSDRIGAILAKPSKCPVMVPFKVSGSFNKFCADNSADPNYTAIELHTMMCAMRVWDQNIDGELKVNGPSITILTSGGNDAEIKADGKIAPDMKAKGDFTKEVAEAWVSNMASAEVRMICLVACEQVRSLSERNIENFYASKGARVTASKISRMISYAASIIPSIAKLDAFKEMSKDEVFLRYHTSATSTPALVSRFFAMVPKIIMDAVLQGVDNKAAVDDALNEPSERKLSDQIPIKLIQHTFVFLNVSNMLPQNWYQGEKAMALASPSKVAMLTAAYKKLAGFMADTASLEQAGSVEDLAHALARLG